MHTSRSRLDHPRVCGEKQTQLLPSFLLLGSPPRMRGKECLTDEVEVVQRITPAYAGKSSRNETCWHRPWDHPCVCGEKVISMSTMNCGWGSPPRMRGKAWGRCCPDRLRWDHPCVCGEKACDAVPGLVVRRITPAYAGKRIRLICSITGSKDHPRMCGEKNMCLSVRPIRTGSPPRVRGKVRLFRDLLLGCGITPAYAGKSAGLACK